MTRRSVERAALGMASATALSRAFGFARVLAGAAVLAAIRRWRPAVGPLVQA
jgi:peptidoglycan biosynthesis protein MviN/MurJ (putative lipid II flippase)